MAAIFGLILSGAMLLPALVDLSDGNPDWVVFVGTGGVVGAVCTLVAVATRGASVRQTPRFGFLLVTTIWLVSTVTASLPLYFAETELSFAAAVFEAMSGLTTTGATALSGLDALPRGLLLWRSLLNFLGGIGIIGMALLILPSLRVGGMALFQLESSDRSGKLLPRVSQLASGIVAVYGVMTLVCAMLYFALGMSLFDAFNHAMSTLATGGFSTHDESLGFFQSDAILMVATVFMIAGSLPFVLYIRVFLPRRFQRWRDPQVALFLVLCVVLSLALAVTRVVINEVPLREALLSSTFNLVSVITTTGFVSEDFTLWSNAAIGIFFLAMFIGGCAGSTAGGIKVNRIIILYALMRANFARVIRPHSVQRLKYGHDDISIETLQSVTIFIFLFFLSLLLGTTALSICGLELLTAFSASLTAVGNVGPGFGQVVGPAGNFSSLSAPALWILSFLMLIGRLEIVTVLVILSPGFWRD
ncbi:trk system potassium uptake protein TrkH [Aureimonas phyllosphaerae]|uniref:Trk system potassium uptake protein n=1 Tax=Aureimonas phyllosphaerae TaxID=1166078 RepID=A0A7W6BPL6_9HYPH|nr:trk system potassium uptake protein TrkH [Aureimonas phyllosphaerae]MBB3959774.1 trk system potassium uptake protein TrkH [Aureimonas phyllosphaerae]SFF14874.1 trk system potassium uptake protein TrkH [Aureimonas phyllosphaerae]